MRFFVIRRGQYAKLHMAEEKDAKDREKLSKIKAMVLGQVLKACILKKQDRVKASHLLYCS